MNIKKIASRLSSNTLSRGHTWRLRGGHKEAGLFPDLPLIQPIVSVKGCSGPICSECGYTFCTQCYPGPLEDCTQPAQEGFPPFERVA